MLVVFLNDGGDGQVVGTDGVAGVDKAKVDIIKVDSLQTRNDNGVRVGDGAQSWVVHGKVDWSVSETEIDGNRGGAKIALPGEATSSISGLWVLWERVKNWSVNGGIILALDSNITVLWLSVGHQQKVEASSVLVGAMSAQTEGTGGLAGGDVAIEKVCKLNVYVTNGNSATSGAVGDLAGWAVKGNKCTGASANVGVVSGDHLCWPARGNVQVGARPGDGLGAGGKG